MVEVNKKITNAWAMYDWASSAFATTIMAAMFPPFFRSLVIDAGLPQQNATAYWGYTTSLALLLVAISAPILGAIADFTGHRKRYLLFFAGLGILATAAFPLIGEANWRLAAGLFICGNVGFAAANLFYESLLPFITSRDNVDRISSWGYAFGYLGGGLLLALNAAWVMKPALFGMPDAAFALRASFFSVALWWGLFSIPLFRIVPEPALRPGSHKMSASPAQVVRQGVVRLRETFREIRLYKQLLVFLCAFWIYNDGIGTIVKMATAYGSEIGIGVGDMIKALIITQFTGIPFTMLFSRLAGRISALRAIQIALGVYMLISIGGYFMTSAFHFYLLAIAVGMVQGGAQALSRSLFSAMVPKHKTTEFFGFFSTSAKFAGIAGPLMFGLISQWVGHSRLSILSLIVFFAAGALLLSRVDVDAGRQAAQAAWRAHRGGDENNEEG
jgi:MFS transporter, UMF1 family